ncbi:MAG: AEC family transporter [Pseudomonadota bacterium]
MLLVLTHNILPVFAMLALGFAMGRVGAARQDEARVLNRIAFLVLQPPLIFMLLSGLDLPAIRYEAIGIYAATEIIAFLAAFSLARFFFKAELAEAFLMAMCVVFVNSLLYIWPISTLIYGEEGARPISVIVALDASITFAFFIIGIEIIKGEQGMSATLPKLARNPVLLTMLVALGLNIASIPIPEPVMTAARFAGAGAAPLTLFALGVVLSAAPLRPTLPVISFSAMKLLLFPILLWLGFQTVSPGNPWQAPFLLSAGGPSGAMAFALALLHGVRTDRIAPVIIWTSLLSLITLAWLA